MSTVRERVVACSEVDDWTRDLAALGGRVLGSTPLASPAGACRLRFSLDAAAPPQAPTESVDDSLARAHAPGGHLQLTSTQKQTIKAIVNLFETGAVLGRYGQVTLIPGDTGRLTYGRSQTTLSTGNLHALIDTYCRNPGARFGSRLAPYLSRLANKEASVDTDRHLHNLLRACADDRVMRETQDEFFEQRYWVPAVRDADRLGVRTPLGMAVVYDSRIHGSWPAMRDRTTAAVGALSDCGERVWIQAYVETRHAWLSGHARADLRATAYRMESFRSLLAQGHWALPLPIVVRGAEISEASLSGTPSDSYDGPPPGSRALGLASPLLRGMDVRLLQLALSGAGHVITADGILGAASIAVIKREQAARGMAQTGSLAAEQVASFVG